MSSTNASSVLNTALIAGFSSVVACIMTMLVLKQEPAPVPNTQSADRESVVQELRRLRGVVEQTVDKTMDATHDQQPAARRRIIPEESGPVETEDLLTKLESLIAIASTAATRHAATIPRHIPANWNALMPFAQLSKSDSKTAARSVSMLTAQELVARFGFPDIAHSACDPGSVYWAYELPGEGNRLKVRVWFVLHSGYVVVHDVDWRDA